jgi:hypothetical protein
VLLLAGTSAAQCTLNTASPSVTICTPANGATVTSPVSVVAGTTDKAHSVTTMKVYLDGVAVYTVHASQINTSLAMANGTHRVTAQAWDSSGAVFKSTINITVSGTGPAPVSVTVSPHSASLAPGQQKQFSATVLNATDTTVAWYVDNFQLGNATVGTITSGGLYTAGTSLGNHNVTAISNADTNKSDTAVVTVSTTTSTFPSSNHVFLIMEENQSYSEVFPSGASTLSNCSSSTMPYLCSLAAKYGMATNFYSNRHDSLLLYLYAVSGSTWTGSPYNCNGLSCSSEGVITGANLMSLLTSAGKTWRGYFEDMPSEGYTGGDTGHYLLHHNPFPWFADVVSGSNPQKANMYPFTDFSPHINAGNFADFTLIVPNSLHDADGTGSQSATALLNAADTWLKSNIAPLLSTPPFSQPGGDGILMVTFDEGRVAGKSGDSSTDTACSPTTSGCGGHIVFVMIGPNVKPKSVSTATYHFQDMVHTIIHLLSLPSYINGASGGTDIGLLPET